MALADLPVDILQLIVSHVLHDEARELDPTDWLQTPSQLEVVSRLAALSLTCSTLRAVCLSSIFSEIDLTSTIALRQAKDFFAAHQHLCEHVTSLRYRRHGAKHAESLRQLLSGFPNLKRLQLRNTFGSVGDLEGLGTSLDELEIIEPYPIAIRSQRLNVLLQLVTDCRPRRLLLQFRHQPELALSETMQAASVRELHLSFGFCGIKSMAELIRWMPNIDDLTIEWYDGGPFVPRAGDVSLAEVLAPVAGQLRKLSIRGGNFFQRVVAPTSPFRLHALAPAMHALQELSLGLFFLSAEGIGNLPASLRKLRLEKMSLPLVAFVEKLQGLERMQRVTLEEIVDIDEAGEAAHAAKLSDLCAAREIDLQYKPHSSALPFFFPSSAS